MRRMERKGGRFSRIGMMSVALLLALCVTGVGYAGWTDEVSVEGTANLGHIEIGLSPGECSGPEVACSIIAPHTLIVTLTNAQPGTHSCGFTIANAGAIPVKIQSIAVSDIPTGVAVSVLGVAEGLQIEQAGVYPDYVEGVVEVVVLDGCIASCSIEIQFSFVPWNMYVA